MSNAYKCDRCGAYYDEETTGEYNITETKMIGAREQDLCDECQDDLDEFMDGAEVSDDTFTGYLDPAVSLDTMNFEIPEPKLEWHDDLPKPRRRTVLQEQVDMGARNY